VRIVGNTNGSSVGGKALSRNTVYLWRRGRVAREDDRAAADAGRVPVMRVLDVEDGHLAFDHAGVGAGTSGR